MKILYVEDDPKDADLALRALKKYLPEVALDVVGTYQEAVARLEQVTDYDLVLTDLKLPDGDGISLLAHVRELDLPCAVVVISGKGDEETAVAALKSGADDYLVKQRDYLKTLPITLENAIQRHHAELDLHAHPLRVLYGEHHAADIDLTRRHLAQYAPFIRLKVVNTPPEITQRLLDTKVREKYDVILLDYSLPGLNTLDLIKEMVQVRRMDVPVVLVTGQGSEDVAVQAIKLGAADYVVKNPGYLFQLPGLLENAFHRAQLVREQAALRESESRFRDLVEHSKDLICTHDLDGNILSANPASARMLGYDLTDILKMKLNDFLVLEAGNKYADYIGAIKKDGKSEGLLFVQMRTGERRIWEYQNSLRTEGVAAPIVRIMANDITERKQAEEKIALQIQRLSTLRAIDASIAGSFDIRVTLDVFLQHVTSQLGVDAAIILLLKPGVRTLAYAAGRGFRGSGITQLHLQLGEDYAGTVALERRLISIPDLAAAEPPFSKASLTANEGFVSYYGVPLIAKGQVIGVLEIFHRSRLEPDPDWLDFLNTLAGQAAIAIDSAQSFENLQKANLNLAFAYDATIEGWSKALDLRDKETEGHTLRVTQLTLQMAHLMGISEEDQIHLRRGALLHDIGKMGVPDSILLKPGPLTDEEWTIMRQHPQYAHDLILPIAYLRPALDIPWYHHEKWDSTGYPSGLKGENIPLAARIFAVVDVWDALISDRPYRKAWSEKEVFEYIRQQAGLHFDPNVVKTFLKLTGDNNNSA